MYFFRSLLDVRVWFFFLFSKNRLENDVTNENKFLRLRGRFFRRRLDGNVNTFENLVGEKAIPRTIDIVVYLESKIYKFISLSVRIVKRWIRQNIPILVYKLVCIIFFPSFDSTTLSPYMIFTLSCHLFYMYTWHISNTRNLTILVLYREQYRRIR